MKRLSRWSSCCGMAAAGAAGRKSRLDQADQYRGQPDGLRRRQADQHLHRQCGADARHADHEADTHGRHAGPGRLSVRHARTRRRGEQATFRQKRDGGPDLWIEGEAERIEYDEQDRTGETVCEGRVQQLEGASRPTKSTATSSPTTAASEFFTVNNTPAAPSKAGARPRHGDHPAQARTTDEPERQVRWQH